MAYVCGTIRDFIDGRTVSNLSLDDLVFAGSRMDAATDIADLGVFKLRFRVDQSWDAQLAALGISRVFVVHVFHGDRSLEGHYLDFISIQECDEYGCKIEERNLKKAQESAPFVYRDKGRQKDQSAPINHLSVPYRIYFLKKYHFGGPIDFGNANSIWKSRAYDLRFYQRVCGWLESVRKRGIDFVGFSGATKARLKRVFLEGQDSSFIEKSQLPLGNFPDSHLGVKNSEENDEAQKRFHSIETSTHQQVRKEAARWQKSRSTQRQSILHPQMP